MVITGQYLIDYPAFRYDSPIPHCKVVPNFFAQTSLCRQIKRNIYPLILLCWGWGEESWMKVLFGMELRDCGSKKHFRVSDEFRVGPKPELYPEHLLWANIALHVHVSQNLRLL